MVTCIDCSDSVSSSSDEEMQVVVQPGVIGEYVKRRHKILLREISILLIRRRKEEPFGR